MSAHSPEELRKHVRTYVAVFIALAVLTVLTVAVSYLHLPLWAAVAIALLIASFKGSLVAGFFMHLVTEKRLIFVILAFTVFFFFALLILPAISLH